MPGSAFTHISINAMYMTGVLSKTAIERKALKN